MWVPLGSYPPLLIESPRIRPRIVVAPRELIFSGACVQTTKRQWLPWSLHERKPSRGGSCGYWDGSGKEELWRKGDQDVFVVPDRGLPSAKGLPICFPATRMARSTTDDDGADGIRIWGPELPACNVQGPP